MDYAIIGGDARFAYLTRLLCSEGYDARAISGAECEGLGVPRADMRALEQAKNVIMNWPQPEEIVSKIPVEARKFYCGPKCAEGMKGFDLWKDERLQLENAWLTAEGAISAAMQTLKKSLLDCRCLVIGWGRIGRALTELLVGMRAQVTVASRSEKGRNGAVERGAESVSTYMLREALPGKQIVFSTAPGLVLGFEELRAAERDALIIDLASAPYGVDLEAARELGLRAWREPGLPGRYCPYSAARALLAAIRRAERKECE